MQLNFLPLNNEAPTSNPALVAYRNLHPILTFDDTTQQIAIFSAMMPWSYPSGGVNVYAYWGAATATTGTIGWDIAFESLAAGNSYASDNFASAQTITATTVPGTAGLVAVTSVTIANGANMASVVAGDFFRLRIRRDVANDSAVGNAQLLGAAIKAN